MEVVFIRSAGEKLRSRSVFLSAVALLKSRRVDERFELLGIFANSLPIRRLAQPYGRLWYGEPNAIGNAIC